MSIIGYFTWSSSSGFLFPDKCSHLIRSLGEEVEAGTSEELLIWSSSSIPHRSLGEEVEAGTSEELLIWSSSSIPHRGTSKKYIWSSSSEEHTRICKPRGLIEQPEPSKLTCIDNGSREHGRTDSSAAGPARCIPPPSSPSYVVVYLV